MREGAFGTAPRELSQLEQTSPATPALHPGIAEGDAGDLSAGLVGEALTFSDIVQGLADAAESDLAVIEITSRGLGLHWPRLDVDVWVPGLVQGITGTEAWMAALGGR